ncbi:MAG: hypothetical protein H7A25_22415 [Leptospiraceae bacterium]|nr:hypothetical protein [Leptospiraceae bacterium]MCP5502669.1 hypothetical protein [Leptospiraceae bacterium]
MIWVYSIFLVISTSILLYDHYILYNLLKLPMQLCIVISVLGIGFSFILAYIKQRLMYSLLLLTTFGTSFLSIVELFKNNSIQEPIQYIAVRVITYALFFLSTTEGVKLTIGKET